ncbi:hypothetical protein G7Z17_g12972 [Cylindrodendrum hubeiense]|uniref:Conidiation-specific protein 6 n=1 Tax=Cylindrodendrum hubeiense TaxID=595255 RepID=A0A9P5GXV9_9HYPO|nr:hypothetical protein G7Z17_g12972 [Cylindrodendrum hubeiense]
MADITRVAAGHKANLSNPNTSEESKEHSKTLLEGELNSDAPSDGNVADYPGKHPGNVAGGLKAAIKNPNVSEEAKESAKERLEDMDA